MHLSLLLLSSLFLIFLYLLLKKIYENYKLFRHVSSQKDFLRNPSWILGHIWPVLSASHDGHHGFQAFKIFTSQARNKPYTETGAMLGWLGNPVIGMPLLVPTRTEILKAVLGTKQRVDKALIYYSLRDVFGDGLIGSDKVIWNKHRKLLNPTFHQQLLHNFVPVMSKESRNLVSQIQEAIQSNDKNCVDNITTLISHRIMAMLTGTAMGLENEEIDPEFMEAAEKFDSVQFRRLQNPIKLIKFYYDKTAEGKEFYQMLEMLHREGAALLKKRLDQMKVDSNKNISSRKMTLLDTLIDEHHRDPQSMTLKMVENEFLTFMGAGWDTTTWTASFSLQMIGEHQDVQDKLFKEIDTFVGHIPIDDDLSMEDLSKLKYLECVINETLRMYPLINIHGRHLYEDLDVEIDGKIRTFPSGTEMIIDSEIIHRSPRYWTDPDKFNPERFMSPDRDPLAFIPFSFGPRNCIGKQFAMIEEKIMISHILRHFKIQSVDKIDNIKMNLSGIARRTHEPIRLIMTPRQ